MAKFGSDKVAFLLIDGYSVLGVTTDLTEDYEAKTEETTPLGAADETHASTGLMSAKMSQSGFFDDEAGSSNDALVAGNGASRVVCYGVEGNTIGKNFVGFAGALQTSYKRQPKVGALHKASADYIGSGQKNEGKILHAHGVETLAAGHTWATSVDNGAATTNGGSVYLEASALTLGGYTNVQIILQDSADNITFTTIGGASFTPITTPTAQRLAFTGTIRRYTACYWIFNGAGSGQSITFMAGIVRN